MKRFCVVFREPTESPIEENRYIFEVRVTHTQKL